MSIKEYLTEGNPKSSNRLAFFIMIVVSAIVTMTGSTVWAFISIYSILSSGEVKAVDMGGIILLVTTVSGIAFGGKNIQSIFTEGKSTRIDTRKEEKPESN